MPNPKNPPRETLDSNLAIKPVAVWLGSDNTWTIACGTGRFCKDVTVNGAFNAISRLANRRYWVLAVRIPGVDSAVMSLELAIQPAGQRIRDNDNQTWRGPRAPPPPRAKSSSGIAGTLRKDSIYRAFDEDVSRYNLVPAAATLRRDGLPVRLCSRRSERV